MLCVCILSCVWLFVTLGTVAHQAPLSMAFSRQKHWSGLPFPTLGNLLDPGIESMIPVSPALHVVPWPLSHGDANDNLSLYLADSSVRQIMWFLNSVIKLGTLLSLGFRFCQNSATFLREKLLTSKSFLVCLFVFPQNSSDLSFPPLSIFGFMLRSLTPCPHTNQKMTPGKVAAKIWLLLWDYLVL